MEYLFISFLAGILTVLAPCVFTLLPVILGGTLTGNTWRKPAVIITSLSISIFFFTLILKASSVLISLNENFWQIISGSILIIFGLITFFPEVWTRINTKIGLSERTDKLLNKSKKNNTIVGDIFVGAALGPVFSSCSPTYAIIVATILPQNFAVGVINLIVYLIGLSSILIVISISGQKIIKNLKWAVNPKGRFKKFIGFIFVLIGLSIVTGIDKKFETYLLDNGILDVTRIEINLLEQKESNNTDNTPPKNIKLSVLNPYKAPEITGINEWINSQPLKISELRGNVVLVDFWTYSCINCIRTLPYITSWYNKYKDDGLVIIGMHSPEFAFEKIKSNVENAVQKYEIKYPVALDNNFVTWSAFNNRYWPAKYFIDKDGNIVHTHFGEGDYEESEKIIQSLLGSSSEDITREGVSTFNPQQTPETYLGYDRLDRFLNSREFEPNKDINFKTQTPRTNYWSLEGRWSIGSEYSTSRSSESKLILTFNAKEVYLVMGADQKSTVKIKVFDKDIEIYSQELEVYNSDLYTVAKLMQFYKNQRLEITFPEGVRVNAFTFGG